MESIKIFSYNTQYLNIEESESNHPNMADKRLTLTSNDNSICFDVLGKNVRIFTDKVDISLNTLELRIMRDFLTKCIDL